MKRALYVGLIAIILVPVMAAAEPQRKPEAKISPEQASKIALEKIPGNVRDVTIEKKTRQERLRGRDPDAQRRREGRPRRHQDGTDRWHGVISPIGGRKDATIVAGATVAVLVSRFLEDPLSTAGGMNAVPT
jgi:hypothetical protein